MHTCSYNVDGPCPCCILCVCFILFYLLQVVHTTCLQKYRIESYGWVLFRYHLLGVIFTQHDDLSSHNTGVDGNCPGKHNVILQKCIARDDMQ